MAEDDFKERRPRRERGSDEPSKWLPAEEYLTNEVNPNEGLPFSRKWRLAVFGGSFDPVHLGHVKLARQVLEHDLADEILFVPAKRSPFKPSKQAETCDDRLEMLSLAIDDAIAEKPSSSWTGVSRNANTGSASATSNAGGTEMHHTHTTP